MEYGMSFKKLILSLSFVLASFFTLFSCTADVKAPHASESAPVAESSTSGGSSSSDDAGEESDSEDADSEDNE
jgi:hypothetical protein